MERDMTAGKVWKCLLGFMVPVFFANVLQALYATVDLAVVGRFAQNADVSGVSTGSMTVNTVNSLIIGLTMGCTVRIGHLVGMNDTKKATKNMGASLCLFLIVGLALAAFTVVCATPIARLMNAPAEALNATVTYIRICGVGFLAIVLFNALSGIFRGVGDSKTPLVLMVISCGVNIAGDLLLCAVFHMGAAGAAIATVFAQSVSVVFAFFKLMSGGIGFPFSLRDIGFHKNELHHILRYGVPGAVQNLLSSISFMVIIAILNGFGLVASAGVGVAEKVCNILFLIPSSTMAAISTFAAQNVGAGQFDRARKSLMLGIAWTVSIGSVVFLFSFFKGNLLTGLFSNDSEVVAAAADYLRSYSIDCAIVGINFSMMGYLNGHGKTTFVAAQGILSTFLVRIPVSMFMSTIPNVTLFQVGFATPLATVFAIVITAIYLVRFEKKNKRHLPLNQ